MSLGFSRHFSPHLLCKHINFACPFLGPLREEAASWAEKLKGVGEVLDLWLETQDLWLDLEAVFSDHLTSKELPQVSKFFCSVLPGAF